MFLKNLSLTNFRNFSHFRVDLPETLLIYGENSLGKSTILESVYFLATTRFPRVEKDVQLVKFGESFLSVVGEVSHSEETTKLEIVMQKKTEDEKDGLEKRVKVNGVIKRTLDYIGNLAVVLFSPEDINLVTGTPALRRWHLDLTLAQIDREYKMALTVYSEALSSRNRILKRIKDGIGKYEELEFWTSQLIKSGLIVQRKRNDLFHFLNQQSFLEIFGRLEFVYKNNLLSQERLEEYLNREIAAASSLIGPHRDDFSFNLNRQDLAYFGSRGQQRTAVLDLKLAELNFIKQVKSTTPVLLLDDIFSELDKKHRDYVISVVAGQQTLLSTVETDNIPKKFLDRIQVSAVNKLGVGI